MEQRSLVLGIRRMPTGNIQEGLQLTPDGEFVITRLEGEAPKKNVVTKVLTAEEAESWCKQWGFPFHGVPARAEDRETQALHKRAEDELRDRVEKLVEEQLAPSMLEIYEEFVELLDRSGIVPSEEMQTKMQELQTLVHGGASLEKRAANRERGLTPEQKRRKRIRLRIVPHSWSEATD